MLSSLKDHPFAVAAFFESSLVLSFAASRAELQALLPPCLEVDTFNDQYGFVAMAMVQTKHLRPKGFPKFMGNNFFLIGYRVFVRYTTNAGKRLRGLYILKSETNKRKMQVMGNLFTHYNYTTTDITQATTNGRRIISSEKSGFRIETGATGEGVALPAGSPFANWKEARRFAGPLPFTFTYNAPKREVLMIEGVRENWTPQPVAVIDHRISFLNTLPLTNPVLANAFVVQNIPYYWKKGKKEVWQP